MTQAERHRRAEQLQAFLIELRHVAELFRWYLDDYSQIRAEHPDYAWPFCPLTAIGTIATGRRLRFTDGHQVAEEIGLAEISLHVYAAADARNRHSTLRANMLRAVGLPREI